MKIHIVTDLPIMTGLQPGDEYFVKNGQDSVWRYYKVDNDGRASAVTSFSSEQIEKLNRSSSHTALDAVPDSKQASLSTNDLTDAMVAQLAGMEDVAQVLRSLEGNVTVDSESILNKSAITDDISAFQTLVPDEEDLTSDNVSGVVHFKDRDFDPTSFSGLGMKILRKGSTVEGSKATTVVRVTNLPTSTATATLTLNGTNRTFLSNAGTPDIIRLRINSVPTVAGTVSVTINGITKTTAVDPATETTRDAVAAKIAQQQHEGYGGSVVAGETGLIFFTSTRTGPLNVGLSFNAGGTGITSGTSITLGSYADSFEDIINRIYSLDFPEFYKQKIADGVLFTKKSLGVPTASVLNPNGSGLAVSLNDGSDNISINLLSATELSGANTMYEIRYDYDLNGATVILPKRSVLKFVGGRIKNGTLRGNETTISASVTEIFGTDINFQGSFHVMDVYPEWFGAASLPYTLSDGDVSMAPPPGVANLPDCSEAFNKAGELSVYSGGTIVSSGSIYRATNTMEMPIRSKWRADPKTVILFYMNGEGNVVTTVDKVTHKMSTEFRSEKVLALLENQFIATKSMKIGLKLNSVACIVEGMPIISVSQSTYTIAVYCKGIPYNVTDMAYSSPKADIRTIGGLGQTVAPDVRDLFGEGTPEASLGNVNQYYFDKTAKKYYQKSANGWAPVSNFSSNADSRYNTSIRFECDFGDARIINPQMYIGDMFGFRGMEICVYNSGWFNDSKISGTISNKHGSFVSIFTDSDVAGNHDWSRLGHQIDSTMGYDTRIFYANRCSKIRFGYTWDLSWIGIKRYNSNLKYELGTGTQFTTISRVDSPMYVKDSGMENIIDGIPNLKDINSISFAQYKNLYKYRTPYSILNVGNNNIKTFTEFNGLQTAESLNNFNPYVNNGSPLISTPNVFFDENDSTFRRVIDTSNNLYAVCFVLNYNGSDLLKSTQGFLEIEYAIDNLSNSDREDKPIYLFDRANALNLTYSSSLKSKRLVKEFDRTSESGFTAKKVKLFIPFKKSTARGVLALGFYVSQNIPCTLDIYAIRYWVDATGLSSQNLNSGNTQNRPNASYKGFVYEDTTIGATFINKGDSTIQNWVELPTEQVGVWTITTGAYITAATANYSKIGKQVNLAGQLTFAGTYVAGANVPIIMPFAPNYGGTYVVGDLTFTLTNNSTTAQVKSATTGANKPFQLNFKTV